MAATENYNIKVLEKALQILNVLKTANSLLGVNEIAKSSSLNSTTTFRILKTLQNYGWVFQNSQGKYMIGSKLSFVTEKDNFYLALEDIAYCTMRRLTDQEGEVMNLTVRQNEKGILIQQSRTSKITDYVAPLGSIHPLYASASGKVLLSELPEILLENILNIIDFKPYTKHTITSRSKLLEELEIVRKRGYALDICESLENACCISVPIRSPSNEIFASLSFSGFFGGLSPKDEEYYFAILQKASQEISYNLFHTFNGSVPPMNV